MDDRILPIGAAHPLPPPAHRPDTRPVADAIALARDPRPNIPLPVPASTGQLAVVAQARITDPTGRVASVERVLKPYGVTMLPHGPQSNATSAKKEEDAGDIETPDPNTDANLVPDPAA